MPAHHAPPHYWTEAEFYAARDAAPCGERWELVDGEVLVTPGPHWTHQRIVLRLAMLIDPYVHEQRIGETFVSPCDVKLEPGLVMQPDVFVVPNGELRTADDIVSRLLLAIEVLSPGSARHDRVTKRPRYQRNRVPEYWIVDDRSRTVERWRAGDTRSELIADQLTWNPEGASAPLVIDLARFFAEVVPEPGTGGRG